MRELWNKITTHITSRYRLYRSKKYLKQQYLTSHPGANGYLELASYYEEIENIINNYGLGDGSR